jgi:hypothetical protein
MEATTCNSSCGITPVTPSASDRQAAIAEFSGAGDTTDIAARGRALRRVAENGTLVQQEFNRAFVLMQYFGYLHRNPNDAIAVARDILNHLQSPA